MLIQDFGGFVGKVIVLFVSLKMVRLRDATPAMRHVGGVQYCRTYSTYSIVLR